MWLVGWLSDQTDGLLSTDNRIDGISADAWTTDLSAGILKDENPNSFALLTNFLDFDQWREAR